MAIGWLWPKDHQLATSFAKRVMPSPGWYLNYLGSLQYILQGLQPDPEFLGLSPWNLNVDSGLGSDPSSVIHYLIPVTLSKLLNLSVPLFSNPYKVMIIVHTLLGCCQD